MAALIREAIEAGEIPDQDAELSAAAVVEAMAEALVGPISPVAAGTRAASDDDTVAAIVSLCRRALGAT